MSLVKEKYRYIAGVQTTMLESDRRTGGKHLRVRGMSAVSVPPFMKAMDLNGVKAARGQKAGKQQKLPHWATFLVFLAPWGFCKEQLERRRQIILAPCVNFQPIDSIWLNMAF